MVTFIEIGLILGLVLLLLIVIFLHFISTTTSPWVVELTGIEPAPQQSPWFIAAETILFLSAFYIFVNLIS